MHTRVCAFMCIVYLFRSVRPKSVEDNRLYCVCWVSFPLIATLYILINAKHIDITCAEYSTTFTIYFIVEYSIECLYICIEIHRPYNLHCTYVQFSKHVQAHALLLKSSSYLYRIIYLRTYKCIKMYNLYTV